MAAADREYDAIVVGSGFGGAVSAARLSQAGYRVLVLERGRRWRAGDFPRGTEFGDGWLWGDGHGLYDLRWLKTMLSIQAAGWGGGSLAYANVFARPSQSMLPENWPAHLSRDALDPYYELAAHMLGIRQVGVDPRTGRLAGRTEFMEQVARRTQRASGTVRPMLAVQLRDDPDRFDDAVPNVHGVAQLGCDFSGECVAGCNRGAKNSVDYNYLAVAEAAGAVGVTGAEVHRIEPVDAGFRVSWREVLDGGADRAATATRVIVAAGAVGSTEMLLRARDRDRTLPALSRRLGEGYSGNGDFLAFVRPRTRGVSLRDAPTITSTTILDVPESRRRAWFQVQDGGFSPALAALADHYLPHPRRRGLPPRQLVPMLFMGEDAAAGVLSLDRRGRVVLKWSNRQNKPLYRAEHRVTPSLRRMLLAPAFQLPIWTLLRRTVTVHNLGGVPRGADAGSGVVDEHGRVHGYPGLWVVDGSTLPGATGVNPSATIVAAAERSLEVMIREDLGRADWRAPEWPDVVPAPVPEDDAVSAMLQRRLRTAGGGVRFAWPLRGRPRWSSSGVHGVRMRLSARIESLDAFLGDPDHEVPVTGVIDVDGVATGAIGSGTLRTSGHGRPLRFRLGFRADDGSAWRIDAQQPSGERGVAGVARRLRILRCEIRREDGAQAVRVIVRRSVLLALATLRGQGFTRARRAASVARFVGFVAAESVRPER